MLRPSAVGRRPLQEDSVIVVSRLAGSAPVIGDTPDCAVCIFGHEQRAIMRLRNTEWTTPDLGVGDHKAGHEILVLAGWLTASVEQQSNDFVSLPVGAA